MKIIGLVGGVASGKSMVAEQLAACGAKVLNADRIAHDVLQCPKIEAALRERWGADIFNPDGRIDRRKVAGIVFGPGPEGPRERVYLEQLTHPEVIKIIKKELAELSKSALEAAVIDAPLVLEAGLDEVCDKLVFVDAPPAARLQRAVARGWRKEDFEAREDAQKSLDFKRRRADVLIDNSGSPEQTQSQVKRLWQALIR